MAVKNELVQKYCMTSKLDVMIFKSGIFVSQFCFLMYQNMFLQSCQKKTFIKKVSNWKKIRSEKELN